MPACRDSQERRPRSWGSCSFILAPALLASRRFLYPPDFACGVHITITVLVEEGPHASNLEFAAFMSRWHKTTPYGVWSAPLTVEPFHRCACPGSHFVGGRSWICEISKLSTSANSAICVSGSTAALTTWTTLAMSSRSRRTPPTSFDAL